ncbi:MULTISPECIES: S9 family peptidase [unclassified Pseudoalteromonas]|uniref:S9 family peptidase n=1 Tax=unclassified Pseudoalteromonas TaxID=194690 RepID=UPI003014FC98
MKRLFTYTAAAIAISSLTACTSNDNKNSQLETTQPENNITAPIAKKIPHKMSIHGDTRIDHYYWMRDDQRKDPEILAHLEAENAYTKASLRHTEALQEKLYKELKSRIKKDDNSVPVKNGKFYYSSEMRGNNEYPIYVRSSDFSGTDKEVILNVNELAKGHSYFSAAGLATSPNNKLLAYGEDTVSRRVYTIKIKDLSTGKWLEDEINGAQPKVVWAADNLHFYYIKKHPETLLGYQVYRHKLGTEQEQDQLVYEEKDNTYYTSISKSKDGSSIFIHHSSTESSGVSLIDAYDSNAQAQRFIPREEGLEYRIAKHKDAYYILTNLNAINFRLMKVNADSLGDKSKWQEVIAHRPEVKLEDIELFNEHLVYQEREMGQVRLTIRSLLDGSEQTLKFNDDVFLANMYGNNELDNEAVRVFYTSLTTPATHYDFDLTTAKAKQLKQTEVLGDFDVDNYASKRIFIPARDGAQVPVSLVYRKDMFNKDGSNPLYLWGYGSYGATIDPNFSSTRLSLLDRGFVVALAHIRGSQMLGRPWYEDGKKLAKKNTFNDFIDVTKSLVDLGYADKERVYAVGGSAGGLLMGAIVNQAPQLYDGVAAHVPFVDVVTTMLDESIPLTTGEYDEWGNPNEEKYYRYMLSYSPYDQVKQQDYPNMLVTTGLHDSQVQYFEPAKWVAKLRELKTDDNKLLFKVDMTAGHGGASGRFKRLHDKALEYAFFLDLAGKNKL